VKSDEFLFAGQRHIGDVAASAKFAASALAKIVGNDVVEARSFDGLPAGDPVVLINPVKHFDQFENANFEPRFFE
jgi:hypothetical protein